MNEILKLMNLLTPGAFGHTMCGWCEPSLKTSTYEKKQVKNKETQIKTKKHRQTDRDRQTVRQTEKALESH